MALIYRRGRRRHHHHHRNHHQYRLTMSVPVFIILTHNIFARSSLNLNVTVILRFVFYSILFMSSLDLLVISLFRCFYYGAPNYLIQRVNKTTVCKSAVKT
jgi:hypothetical protein